MTAKNINFLLLLMLLTVCSSSCSMEDKIIDSGKTFERGYFADDWKYVFNMNEPDQNAFRLWLPEDIIPRAVIVLAPGNASDGTNLVNHIDWQEFARNEKVALLGAFVRSDTEIAATNLLIALNEISKERNIEYISDLPLLLRGHSHGGRFSYEFANFHPKKVVAFANIKGPLENTSTDLPPGLFIVGEKDLVARNETIKNAFLSQREKKNVICYAEELGGGHGVGDADDLVRVFFSSVLKKRLINGELIDLNEEEEILANIDNFEAYSYANYPYNKEEAACLIDDDFKIAWLQYVK